jgi:hypothetical protein
VIFGRVRPFDCECSAGKTVAERFVMTRLLAASCVLGAVSLLVGCGDDSSPGGNTAGGGSGGSSGSSVSTSGSAGISSGGTAAGTGGTSAGSAGQSTGGQSGGGTAGAGTSGSGGSGGSGVPSTEKFSFFVASVKAMVKLSNNKDGFGGDLTFGETGPGAGLKGADKICTTIAETSMPNNNKTWRAFLSVTKGPDGTPVHAIDRIGAGPWYDRTGRLVSMNKTNILEERPGGADDAIVDDLPNEDGVPNHEPDVGAGEVDNHDILTGTGTDGKLFENDTDFTCNDWTSKEESGSPHCGHAWPRGGGFGGPGGGSGNNWMSALDESGCAPGIWLEEAGPPGANGTKSVGDGGGYGGIYCFALTP